MQCIVKVPFVDLAAQNGAIKDELLSAVSHVLDSGQFIHGKEVGDFERAFADLCDAKFALGVNSGTDALIMALRALEIGKGDEVITVANSYVTTASSIAYVGAKPVFIDVKDDYTMDPALLKQAVTERTKAVIPVHLTGRPADMTAICKIAKGHDLYVVEDAAQAAYAELNGKKVGLFGDIGCFSFHPLKVLNACGDGGALITNNEKIHEKLLLYGNNGIFDRNYCKVWSSNSRLDTVQAAILLVKMKYVPAWIEARQKNANLYRKLLKSERHVQCPVDQGNEKATYHLFVIQADRRDQLKDYLAQQGIATAIHYPIPIHFQEASRSLGYQEGSLPVTERQSKRILSLPVYPELGEDNLRYVADSIREFYQKKGEE